MSSESHNRQVKTLQSGLQEYSAAVKRPATDWKERLGSWPLYAAATGSALAFATSAHAGTIYSGVQNLQISVPEAGPLHETANGTLHILGQLFTFNLNRTLRHSFYGGSDQAGRAFIGGNAILDDNGSRSARRLASGANITAGAPFVGVFGANNLRQHKTSHFYGTHTTTIGEWFKNDDAFAGIRVHTGGGDHLGWIQIRLQDTNSDDWVDHMTIVDWAYNDVAGASIAAGDTGAPSAVPEPGTRAMALLAVGAAGVLALRKRRQQA